jgi:hypothetical protein
MQVNRESFYRCIFSSPYSRRVAHVRAWDESEALQLFRTELRADGVHERGTFEVFPMHRASEGPSADHQP